MSGVIWLALGLIIGGLLMCYLRGSVQAEYPLLARIILYVGVFLVVVGLIFLVAPAVVWVDAQLRRALGT